MALPSQRSFLELSVIWKDDDIVELSVTAANNNFSGRVDVYNQSDRLLRFAISLAEASLKHVSLFYEAGEKNSYAYFSMRYYPVGFTGHIGVEINLESNVATEYRPEKKDKLKLEIIVEPARLDIFQKELCQLARLQIGKATLCGRDN